MFKGLKEKFWGKQLYVVDVESRAKSSVYIWEKNGIYTLNIRSENFSYIQGPVRNDGTVTFNISEIDSLLSAIKNAVQMKEQMILKGGWK